MQLSRPVQSRVVEPESTGIGVTASASILRGSDKVIAMNGSGRAPAALTTEWLLDPTFPKSYSIRRMQ